MKNIVRIIAFCLIFSFYNIISVSAEEINPPVSIDGIFDDWGDKPSLIDPAGDGVNNHEDLKEVRYITDDKYLYLYIERYPVEDQYKNGGLWDIWIPIINGNGNGAYNCFFPWDKVEGEVWQPRSVSRFEITTHFVEVWDQSSQSMVKEFRVNVTLGGQPIGENRSFTNADGTKLEVRLPLELVGLSGNDEIIFAVGSDIGAENDSIDWISNEGPITSTQGPIFGALTLILGIIAFIWVGKLATRKQ